MLQELSEQGERNTFGKDIAKRELIEIRHEWVCSQRRCQFYNAGCILDGLTLSEIILHVTLVQIRILICERKEAEHLLA